MEFDQIRCFCGLSFVNAIELGKHRRLYGSQPRGASSSENVMRDSGIQVQEQVYPAVDPFEAEVLEDSFPVFGDCSSPIFENEPELLIPVSNLCRTAVELVKFCCTKRMSSEDVEDQYNLLFSCTMEDQSSESRDSLRAQFPNARQFSSYIRRLRRHFVSKQGWRVAKIQIEGEENKTGVFRSFFAY